MTNANPPYLLAHDADELARLQLQSRTWEPVGAAVLESLGIGEAKRAVDVGCGVMGWLRILSAWVGHRGQVVGTDFDEGMLARAKRFVEGESLANVSLVRDDLFDSHLPTRSFDLVHARFQLAPLGRVDAQLASYARLAKPGGWIVLEEPDSASWRCHPEAPATAQLVRLILQAFNASGGDFDIGRDLPGLLRPHVERVEVRAHVLPLTDGHPYARLPIQFAGSLRPKLLASIDAASLDELIAQSERELADKNRWSTSFTLVSAFGKAI